MRPIVKVDEMICSRQFLHMSAKKCPHFRLSYIPLRRKCQSFRQKMSAKKCIDLISDFLIWNGYNFHFYNWPHEPLFSNFVIWSDRQCICRRKMYYSHFRLSTFEENASPFGEKCTILISEFLIFHFRRKYQPFRFNLLIAIIPLFNQPIVIILRIEFIKNEIDSWRSMREMFVYI